MRICIDLDGVICQLRQEGETYSDVLPINGAIEKLQELQEKGHYLIIHTARHMKTCGGNSALAVARIGKITLDWLAKYEVPFDEIIFGKPWAHIYIDDNAFRFSTWDDILSDGSNLPQNKEEAIKK